MPTTPPPGSRWPDRPLPRIVQGEMGAAVSSWRLAGEVARTGQLGVVSGTALDLVMTRRLQDGDPDRAVRRALSDLPFRNVAAELLEKYFVLDGREPDQPYGRAPKAVLPPGEDFLRVAVAAAFVEVRLAKRGDDSAMVGIDCRSTNPISIPATIYGAMLAGVDVVLVGADLAAAREVPRLLDELATGHRGSLGVDVLGAPADAYRTAFDAREVFGGVTGALRRPALVTVVDPADVVAWVTGDPATAPDGLVVAGSASGGHAGADREPVAEHLQAVVAAGVPFWLADGRGPDGLTGALAKGATGIQVGTEFTLARESGLRDDLRDLALDRLRAGVLEVRTEQHVSPLGTPYRVAQLPGTLSEEQLAATRVRPPCDLGYLRRPYVRPTGTVGYQCPAEPLDVFVRKGGTPEAAAGRGCLCNSMLAAAGLGQVRGDGARELPLVTLGADVESARSLARVHPTGWSARDVVEWLLGPVAAQAG